MTEKQSQYDHAAAEIMRVLKTTDLTLMEVNAIIDRILNEDGIEFANPEWFTAFDNYLKKREVHHADNQL